LWSALLSLTSTLPTVPLDSALLRTSKLLEQCIRIKTILISVGADVKTHIAIAANKAGVKFQLLDGGDNAIGDENTDWVGTLASGDYKIKITSQQATKFDIAIAQVRE